jgi:hypothetical protein
VLDLVVRVRFPVVGHILRESIVAVDTNGYLLALEVEARSRHGLSTLAKDEEVCLILALLNHLFEAII